MQQMMDIGRDIDALEPQLFGMVHLANTLAFMTRFDDALPAAERALAAVREAGHLRFEAELLTFTFPVCHLRNGDLAAAVESVERGMEIALAIGDRESELFAAVLQGKLASARGHLEDALALSRRARAAGDATGIPYLQALGACVTGTCFLEIGGPAVEDAQAHHREALELMELPTGTIAGAWLWTEIGHCALAVGKVAEAAALFERALTQPTMPMWLIRPSTLAGVVGVALAEGRVDDAAAASAELEQYVTERSMHDQYPLAAMVAGRVAAAAGDHESALARFGEVAEMIGGGGMLRLERDLAAAPIPSLMALGRDEEASAARVEVRRLSEEMAARIGDEGLRTALLTGAPTLPAPA